MKKSEQQLLLKIKKIEDEEQDIQLDTKDIPVVSSEHEQKPIVIQNQASQYIPVRDNPIVQSVCNSGWQVSDIWRDIRVDNFSD